MILVVWLLAFTLFTFELYRLVGFRNIGNRYRMLFKSGYWVNYNLIEFCAWMAKALIIIPGLIFGVELWWGHWITLITSSLLIWASMKKKLPTLILFNTIWIGISLLVLIRHYIG
jgi:hypothetical protein